MPIIAITRLDGRAIHLAASADILEADSLPDVVAGQDAVVNLASHTPQSFPGKPADFIRNDRIRREGTANLLAAALTSVSAHAQDAQDAQDATQEADSGQEGIDIEVPGITVTGTRDRNVQRATSEVVSVLSADDIARTGEGDIAGALGRVTGLSVVGNGFVFVRGLGDRYSLALLNGSPRPGARWPRLSRAWSRAFTSATASRSRCGPTTNL